MTEGTIPCGSKIVAFLLESGGREYNLSVPQQERVTVLLYLELVESLRTVGNQSIA